MASSDSRVSRDCSQLGWVLRMWWSSLMMGFRWGFGGEFGDEFGLGFRVWHRGLMRERRVLDIGQRESVERGGNQGFLN